jgi:concanavalin A-like lectin/glucanase superfamily protein
MSRLGYLRLLALGMCLGGLALVSAVPFAEAAGRPLQTAIAEDFPGPDVNSAFARMHAAGASLVLISAHWDLVAPGGEQRPAFDPSSPADPAYDWVDLDRQVKVAAADGLEAMIAINGAPLWAQSHEPHPASFSGFAAGPYKPDPTEVGLFAHAVALRYSGSFEGLPRVRYWRFWNEPNLIGFLSPQFVDGKPFAPSWYRLMLNAASEAILAIHRDNVVVAGSLAPFGFKTAATAPLSFMRSLLCMSKGRNPKPVCSQRSSLSAFSVHPYTSGSPTHRASHPDDVSLGNLPDVRRLLEAAVRYHRIRSSIPVRFFVTEFSWDTRPQDPNPLALPLGLQARWTAEALYRMWKSGVSLATWFLLRDQSWPEFPFQSGLYFRSGIGVESDLPKPTLTAFRFPFVAYRQRRGTFVWGRTPGGRPGMVIVEQRLTRKWKRIATVRANGYGIFTSLLHTKGAAPKAPATPVARAAYSAAVVADSPSSYWRLDEAAGSTAKDLVGGHAASAHGGVTFGVPGALLNDRDTAVRFNGADGRIDLGSMNSPRTVELWMKAPAQTKETPLFSNRNALQQYLYLGMLLRIPHVFDSFGLFGGTTLANNRWHHVVFTYSGITGKIYVDGRLDGENTWIRPEGEADASLGFDVALPDHFKGSIDDVAVYDHALTDRQVQQHFVASGRKLVSDPEIGSVRARLVGSADASLPFSLKRPPDRYVLPFGG